MSEEPIRFKIATELGVRKVISPLEILNTDRDLPYRFRIETNGGSIIEGEVVPSRPLAITSAANDIKSITIHFYEDSIKPVHLVK